MASRTKQKEEARARRLAEEQARTEKARRTRRLQMLGGVVIVAIAVVAVAIAVSSGGGNSTAANIPVGHPCAGSDKGVCDLLAGIPQSGNTLGKTSAPVTVTEYGDLECPVCADFATGGIESQLIKNEVRQGKAKLVFRSLETATSSAPNAGIFGIQQASALAAGNQNKAWNYIEDFYHHQGQEGSGYVNQTYLDKLAKSVPGLDYSKWLSDSHSQSLLSQVNADESSATGKGYTSTPTIVIVGPKGQAQPITGIPNSYGDLQSAISSVS